MATVPLVSSSSGMSRRALFGLGLSRVGQQRDRPEAEAAPAARPAPGRPVLADLRARWDAARTAEGDAVWAGVGEELRALGREIAPAGDEDPVVSVFGPQSTPATRGAIDALFDAAPPGGIVAFSVWTPGVVAQLLKAAAELDPLPPGVPGVWGWGSRERLRQDLDHHADELRYRRRELRLPAASPADGADRLARAVPALGAAVERRGEAARAEFAGVVEFYAVAVEGGAADDAPVTVPVPYLLVAARRR